MTTDRKILFLLGAAVLIGAFTAFGGFLLAARLLVVVEQAQPVLNRASPTSTHIVTVATVFAAVSVLLAGAILLFYARRKLVAERTAKDTAALLRSTVENITQGVLVFDRNSLVIAWNHQYLDLRGIAPARMRIGMEIGEIQKLTTAMTLTVAGIGHDSRTLAPGFGDLTQPFDGEGVYADGRVLQVSGRPAIDGHYVVTVSDITALKKSEAAFRDKAIRLASLLDTIVDAIVTINEQGLIESWSKGAERLFGYSEEEVMLRNVSLLMPKSHDTTHDDYLRAYTSAAHSSVVGRRRDVEARHKDGHRIDVELGVSEMFIDSQRLFVGVMRDISQRMEIERLKSGFVSTVSHELRTPLTSIAASLGLLAGTMTDQMPTKGARLIEIAKQNSDRLVRLINDILDLEKTESGKMEFKLETLALAPLLQQAVDSNRGYAEGFGTTIEFHALDMNAAVFVDRDRLLQVLTNLLSNAVKFSPRGGVVSLSATREGTQVRVIVQDEGPGIAKEFAPRIFHKFAQADSSDSRAKGGTGLGLAIAKMLVERLGGSIGFDSEAPKGARFYVMLPVALESNFALAE